MSDQATPAVLRLNAGLGPLVEPAAWANNADLISARLGRERYGVHSASELHTWSEGGPTDYHAAALYTEAQMLDRVAAERERCAAAAREVAEGYRSTEWGKAAECIGDACIAAIRRA